MNEQDPHNVGADDKETSQAQRNLNAQTGSEPLNAGVGHKGQPTTNEKSTNLPNGLTGGAGSEFRLGDKITIRPLGSAGTGEVELMQAGNPKTVKVSDVELAGFLIDKYFTDDRT